MVYRLLADYARSMARKYPIVTILGPRLSGKTTLVKMAFPNKEYVNLEHPVARDYAISDPGWISG